MDLYFASAEQPAYLDVLLEQGVSQIGISYYEWVRRHDNDRLPKEPKICITPGISKKSTIDFAEFAHDFCEFAELYAERAVIYDIDSIECPASIRHQVRNHLSTLPNTVLFPLEDESLEELAQHYERIGVNASMAKSMTPNDLRRIQASLYGSNVLDQKTLRTGRFVATTTMAWLSPRRYGELWVYSGGRLWHHGAQHLRRAVQRHRGAIEGFSCDPERCLANDHDELTTLAIRSMLAMSDAMGKRRRDVETAAAWPVSPVPDQMAMSASSGAISASQSSPGPNDRQLEILPVLAMKAEVEGHRVASTTTSVRRCDSCNLSGACPKFEPRQACAFDIPVEIKTRAQWQHAAQVLLETQFSRAMFSHFADQVDGGLPSKGTGGEIDRFFKVLTSVKELEHIDPPKEEGVLTGMLQEMGLPPGVEEDEDEEVIEAELVHIGFADEQTGTQENDQAHQ